MPVFDFRCCECGHEFEAYQHLSDPCCGQRTVCGLCGSPGAVRRYTPIAHFVEMAGFREGFDPALDRYIGSKRAMKEEMKLVEAENYEASGLDMKLERKG